MDNKNSKSDSRNSLRPKVIIYDIFSRLPIDSSMRLKCFSKFSSSDVSYPCFVDIHHSLFMTHPKRQYSTRSRDEKFSYTIYKKVEHKITISLCIEELYGIRYPRFDYVNGLFCLWSRKNHLLLFIIPLHDPKFHWWYIYPLLLFIWFWTEW